jgi:hypothetical protein
MANVPTALTLCEVNYDFDEYGYEEVIPLRGTLSLTSRRPSDGGGVYRYDKDFDISLLSADNHLALAMLVSIIGLVAFPMPDRGPGLARRSSS